MAKAKKTAPRKNKRPASKRPASAPDANLLADLLKWAKAAGADSADALYVNGEFISVAQRMGKREKLESSEGRDLGLRVFVGQRQAFVSSTDFAPAALRIAGHRAVDMARAVPEDPVCGIAPEELLAQELARPRPRTTRGGRRPRRCWPWRRKPRMPRAPSRA